MAIVGNENYNPAMFLEEVPAASSEVFGSAVQQAMLDNPTQRVATEYQFYSAEKRAKEENLPRMSREEATKRATDMGISIANLPDEISEEGFKILSDRQYERRKLDISVNSGDSITAKLAGGLIGSLADPINVASAFIPVPGINGLTTKLAQAGTNIFTKSLVRAQIGAVEGLVGAAVVEGAVNYPVAGKIGDDYGLGEFVTNTVTGAVAGALLHPAVGLAKDVLDPRLNAVHNMSPDTKGNYAQTVMAQAMDDRPINTALMDVVRAKELSTNLDRIEKAQGEALINGDQNTVDWLEGQKKVIQEEMHQDVIDTLSKLSDAEIKSIHNDTLSGKGDRYAPPKQLEDQDLELSESLHNDIENNIEAITQEEIQYTQDSLKQMDESIDTEMKLADQYAKETKDFTDMVKSFAKCITRGS